MAGAVLDFGLCRGAGICRARIDEESVELNVARRP